MALAGANALLRPRDVSFACLREMLAIAGMTGYASEARKVEGAAVSLREGE